MAAGPEPRLRRSIEWHRQCEAFFRSGIRRLRPSRIRTRARLRTRLLWNGGDRLSELSCGRGYAGSIPLPLALPDTLTRSWSRRPAGRVLASWEKSSRDPVQTRRFDPPPIASRTSRRMRLYRNMNSIREMAPGLLPQIGYHLAHACSKAELRRPVEISPGFIYAQ